MPHELGLAFGWHVPEQSWLPAAQTPMHDWLAGMHKPAHSFWPVGQMPLQVVPSQVATPPVGTGHATQAEPQLATSALLTHRPVQLCVPAAQIGDPLSVIVPRSGPASTDLLAGASIAGRASMLELPAWPPDPDIPDAPPDSDAVPAAPLSVITDRGIVQPATAKPIVNQKINRPRMTSPRGPTCVLTNRCSLSMGRTVSTNFASQSRKSGDRSRTALGEDQRLCAKGISTRTERIAV
jgi:hypothetical protein